MIFSRSPFARLRSSKLAAMGVAVLVASLSVVGLGGGVAQAAPQPAPTTTASCQNPNSYFIHVAPPYAQTFTAQKSGKLTSARMTVDTNGNYLLQILGVDQNGEPSQVLASKTIPVSGASRNTTPKPVVANYDPATAPTLEAGKQYAIRIDNTTSSPRTGGYGVRGSANSTCPGTAYANPESDNSYSPDDRFKFDFRVDVAPPANPTPTPTPSTPGSGSPKPAPAPGSPAPAPAPAPGPAPVINMINQSQSASSGPVNQSASIPNNKGGNDQASQQLLQASNTANQQNQQAANQLANQNTVSGPITGSAGQANNVSQTNNQAVNVSPRGFQQSSAAR